MVVYRVENKKGHGPFQMLAEDDYKLFSDLNAANRNKKIIHEEIGLTFFMKDFKKRHRFYRCGCASLDDLLDWFGDFLSELEKYGFEIYCYEVKEKSVYEGTQQVYFWRNIRKRRKVSRFYWFSGILTYE